MSEPTRIRALAQADGALVRALLSHEMETGLRLDAAGNKVTAWHITQVAAAWNGRTVMTAQWGTAIAKNPYIEFVVKGAKAGDRIRISWVDSRGDQRSDEAVIA